MWFVLTGKLETKESTLERSLSCLELKRGNDSSMVRIVHTILQSAHRPSTIFGFLENEL